MRALTTALTALGVLLLAGCGGNPEASPPPTPSATASPSASPSAEPPEMPAAAKVDGRRGTEAFVRYYVELINFAGSSGQTRPLLQSSADDCVKCRDLASGIDEIYASGGRIVGGGWTVADLRHYGRTQGRYFVDVVIDSSPQTLERADGTSQSFPGAQNRLRAFVLERKQGTWIVSELDPTA